MGLITAKVPYILWPLARAGAVDPHHPAKGRLLRARPKADRDV